jgi:GT2 family glycosyltransferase
MRRYSRPVSPTVEVCIVSYNSAATLRQTLTALSATAPDVSVAIREHGSASALVELRALAATVPLTIRIDGDDSNPGFGAGCNALARESVADFVLFLNPDAEVCSWPWSAQPPPARTVVGPRMLGEGEAGRQSGVSYGILDEVGRSWFRRTGPLPSGQGFVSGAALLVDRSSFERIGGFDERYFMYYEDIDFCRRANALGIPTLIEPTWTVRHEGAHATRQLFGRSLQWSYESACRFHGTTPVRLFAYRAYVVVDSSLRAGYHTIRRHRAARSAYLGVLRRAVTDLTRPVRG